MKFFIVLTAVLGITTGSAIPEVPGDNSHYIEGESRYIWMPDGKGFPHLVDLHKTSNEESFQARNVGLNEYWLFTRQNPTQRQVLVHGNVNSVSNSNFLGSRPLKVIVHGWISDGNSIVNTVITSAFLDNQDCNIIVVDWRTAANDDYMNSFNAIPSVGRSLGFFLLWLINVSGGDWNKVHLVGYSLGAHVVGNAGRTVFGRPSRVTGLDPAGPGWYGNSFALNKNDGQYVEVIHTDGRFLGIFNPIGDADFYPNGGTHPQPGCALFSTCSHERAIHFFAATVRYNHIIGRTCANINQVSNPNLCTGGSLRMGNAVVNKRGFGIFAMTTGNSFPF